MKVIQGNPGKRPLPKNEPKPALGAEAPPWLTAPLARAESERIAPRLLKLGLLTELDGEAFGLLCGHLADAGEQTRMGRPVDPRLTSEIRQFMGQFGMTPATRAKVAGKPAEETDPFAEWRGILGRPESLTAERPAADKPVAVGASGSLWLQALATMAATNNTKSRFTIPSFPTDGALWRVTRLSR